MSDLDGNPKDRFARDEPLIFYYFQEVIKMYNDSDAFYYSTTYDLTSSVQHQYSKSYGGNQPIWKRADKRFFWNKHMLKELLEQQVCYYHNRAWNITKIMRKQWTGTWAIRRQVPLSKPKWEITKITNRQNTMRTNGQPSGQLFPKRWSLSNPSQTKSIMN